MSKRIRRAVAAVVLPFAATATASAQNLLVNPGFETPATAPGGTILFGGGSMIGGWLVVGGSNSVALINTLYGEPGNGMTAFQTNSGLNSLDLTGAFNSGTSSGVQQTVGTVSGNSYLLSFFLGRAQSSNGSFFYVGNPAVGVSINGGPQTSFVNSNAGSTGFVNWQMFSFQFVAAGPSTTVTLFNGNGASDVNEAGLDDVSLVAVGSSTTPEPGTWALLTTGLLGVAGTVRRRRRAA